MNNESYKQNTGNLEAKTSSSEPELVQVVLHNDDFTAMDFVVDMLEKYFFMDRRKAAEVMLEAHQQGRAACGVFTKDVAESKLELIHDLAQKSEYPLVCSMEAA